MEHFEFPILIKSTTDGERLREQIRHEREQIKRRHAGLVADIKATLDKADRALAHMVPTPKP